MAPPYRDSFPSDHDDLDLHYSSSHHLFFPILTPQASSSSSSSLSFTALDHSMISDDPLARSIELKHEGGVIMGCNNDQSIGNHEDHMEETGLRFTIWKQIDKRETSSCCENNNNDSTHNDSVKWSSSSSSSKIKFMINSNQTETTLTRTIESGRNVQDLNNSPSPSSFEQTNKRTSTTTLHDGGAIIRTCSDCNTTKTPLWRSGPRGPKSLCNACGIRQRKARRAMAEAAAAAANGGAVVVKTNKVVQHKITTKPATTLKRKYKDEVVVVGGDKKGGGRKKLCFEEIKMGGRLSEISSSYQRVFPQDEREAAILLMTLSYGLLHG
ncbi:putative GATA transcription factor 22 [Cucumis sativus]|uniref:GATA-type domain-containing protein n=1 Tax=Cucumis sativus TaxID=3659 RepID=A0A0A0LZE4_CUCSA|nr:putative GATA transcription factor 22 [Cucumis sativus]KGN66237.1 hypothetical protein Csa_007289 [Cucumis sativus]